MTWQFLKKSTIFDLITTYTSKDLVGTHLNCIYLSMQIKWVLTTYAFIKKIRKKNLHKTSHQQCTILYILCWFFFKVYP